MRCIGIKIINLTSLLDTALKTFAHDESLQFYSRISHTKRYFSLLAVDKISAVVSRFCKCLCYGTNIFVQELFCLICVVLEFNSVELFSQRFYSIDPKVNIFCNVTEEWRVVV